MYRFSGKTLAEQWLERNYFLLLTIMSKQGFKAPQEHATSPDDMLYDIEHSFLPFLQTLSTWQPIKTSLIKEEFLVSKEAFIEWLTHNKEGLRKHIPSSLSASPIMPPSPIAWYKRYLPIVATIVFSLSIISLALEIAAIYLPWLGPLNTFFKALDTPLKTWNEALIPTAALVGTSLASSTIFFSANLFYKIPFVGPKIEQFNNAINKLLTEDPLTTWGISTLILAGLFLLSFAFCPLAVPMLASIWLNITVKAITVAYNTNDSGDILENISDEAFYTPYATTVDNNINLSELLVKAAALPKDALERKSFINKIRLMLLDNQPDQKDAHIAIATLAIAAQSLSKDDPMLDFIIEICIHTCYATEIAKKIVLIFQQSTIDEPLCIQIRTLAQNIVASGRIPPQNTTSELWQALSEGNQEKATDAISRLLAFPKSFAAPGLSSSRPPKHPSIDESKAPELPLPRALTGY
ncbi:hypothetical protein BH10PSE19_BH10PSE19_03110 [soil metagenome]